MKTEPNRKSPVHLPAREYSMLRSSFS